MTGTDQRSRFLALADGYRSMYASMRAVDISMYLTPMWLSYLTKLEPKLHPSCPWDFLRIEEICAAMNNTDIKMIGALLPTIEANYRGSAPLTEVLKEDDVGCPHVTAPYASSCCSLMHLYHLVRFDMETGALPVVRSVVEWGGGFGRMAVIARRVLSGVTHTIVDVPLMSCLQWLYLSVVLGESLVNVVRDGERSIKDGVVNLVPVYNTSCLLDRSNDLFLSTWALCESGKVCQDIVFNSGWFSSKHRLLAFQKSVDSVPFANRVKEKVIDEGISIKSVDYNDSSYYAFF